MSLRSAMRKYAEGGDVTNAAPDYSRANDAFGGAGGVNDLRNQFLGMGLDENTIGSIFSQYYKPETSQPAPQTMTPIKETPRPDPRYEEQYPLDLLPDRPVMPEIYPQQPQGPRTSYRQEADGTLTEIGYDGQPISGYTEQQTAMDRATRGLDPSEYRYVYNGEGYDKVPNGPQVGYNPETQRPDPMDFRKEQEAEEERKRQQEIEDLRREQESIARQREAEEYYFRMRNAQSEDPGFYQPPVYDNPMPVPPPEVFPQYPTDPGFYQPPVDYYNPSPPMDFTQDPGFAPTPTPIGIAKSAARGGDIGKLLQDLTSRSKDRTGGDVAKLVAELLARNGGGGSLDEQRRLMELLGSIRG
jgi:hypothetical protein